MELYIVRHGETLWNKKNLLQGSADIELTENGRELAGKLGEKLEDISFDMIFSSPLIRAYETANLIRGHRNIPIIRDERLKEISFGVMEGHDYAEVFSDGNPQYAFFSDPIKYVRPDNGEDFEDLIARTGKFYEEVLLPAAKKCERIMVVGHGTSNKALICNLINAPIERFWGDGLQKNGEADIYLFDGEKWDRKPGAQGAVDERWGHKIKK